MNNTSSTSSSPKQPNESEPHEPAQAEFTLVLNDGEGSEKSGIFATIRLNDVIIAVVPETPHAIRSCEILASSLNSMELLYKMVDVLAEEDRLGIDFNDPVVDINNDIAAHLNKVYSRTQTRCLAVPDSSDTIPE
jgi:hypothetical protein